MPPFLADYSLPQFLSWRLSGCSPVLGGPGPGWCLLGVSSLTPWGWGKVVLMAFIHRRGVTHPVWMGC